MSTRLKPYPRCKDSRIPWLGHIPTHWEVKPLKRIGKLKGGSGFPDAEQGIEDGELPFYKVSDMNLDGNEVLMCSHNNSISTGTARRLGASVFPRDAIIFPKVGAALLTNKRRILSRSACIDNNTMAFTVTEGVVKFLFYRLLCFDLGRLANPGAVPSLNEKEASEIAVATPPTSEQQAIAAFLDRETGKIDALAKMMERLIELLQEQRTALISHAVTQGLNPNTPKKDSGIPWLGHVPAHWPCAPVSARYKVQLGKMLDASQITGEHLAPYLRNIDVQWGRVNIEDLPQMDFMPHDKMRFSLKIGDLLVCEGGEVGRSAIWHGELFECYYQKAIHRLRPCSVSDEPRFMFYVLFWASTLGVFVAGGNSNTIDHLTADKLRKHRFAFPPRSEQIAIADLLDREIRQLDALVAKVRTAIERLQEYRTALISAAVTGQIDVRSHATAVGN